jgi:2-oxo-4-hydroxy-4-carboxy--5-ureidoimidazoline (OHCU) decarboxylase
MPALAQLNVADRITFARELGHLFERSRWVADETWE